MSIANGRARAALARAGIILPVFVLGHFSHHVVVGAINPLLPRLRDEMGLDYSSAGLLISAFTFTYAIMQVPAASLGNWISRRKVVAWGLVGTGAAGMLMGLVGGFWEIAILLVAIGFFGSTYHALASAFLSITFGKEHRGRSLGLHTVGGSASLFVTPALAVGIAGAFDSWRAAYVVLGALPIAAGLLLLVAARREEAAHTKAAAAAAGERVPVREIARLIGLLVLIAMVAAMLSMSVNSFLPLYMVDKHGVDRDTAGVLLGLVFGGGVIGAPVGGALSDRFGRRPIILASLLAAGPVLYLLTLLPFGWAFLIAMFVYGLILSMRMPVMESVIADVVPLAQRGTALGVYFFLSQETAAVATPVVGWLMDVYGADPTFVGLAVVGIVAGALALLIRGGEPARRRSPSRL